MLARIVIAQEASCLSCYSTDDNVLTER